ncbi:MAG: helicase-related protein, partial [Gemmatimonadota bacterium]
GYRAEALHGGMSQEQRDRVMGRLRAGTADLLIATDVAARGLDVEHLTHVINYDVPTDPDAYIHRIGRVGRAGRGGIAITFAEPREHRLLRNIEQVTKQKIEMAHVPTVADLRARRLDLTRASLQELLIGGELDDVRVVVEALSEEHDIMDIALAAVKLAHQSSGNETDDDTDIPTPTLFPPKSDAAKAKRGKEGARKERRPSDSNMVRIFIGAGRDTGIRPQDLVGAITNEAGIRGSEIGSIEIGDRFSLVDLNEAVVEDVLDAMRRTKIKGQKVLVKRDRGPDTGGGVKRKVYKEPDKKRRAPR